MDKRAQQEKSPLYSGGTTSDPTAPTFKIGFLKGKLGTPPDFLEPMDLEKLKRWESGQ